MSLRTNLIPKVKICGIRDIPTAELCVGEGADWIGLNFVSASPRNVTVSKAQEIVRYLRSQNDGPEIVLLFYKNSPEEIRTVRSTLDHDLVQWVWDDPMLRTISKEELLGSRQICSYRVQKEISDSDLRNVPGELLILDSYSKDAGGGTGESFRWELVSGVQRRFLLAGGLTPENVRTAVETVQPYGVDVASGVESAPGVKDPHKIIQFIRNAKTIV
ncbi:phosphoribosylanthranilate isomerase [Leptospira gomenensis]|uniref:N-(5'-phosphoribosyl)anthranilate isomerase n=1 Tax=Leptospira gomenensis TaxID=2484974 RepID=A0A5F1YST0_9LEPT|nr:phosphoribosylanthranilate isomerase [Leptospira gomenensis]TGK35175.1 phosphoribosylanthranilate isomerase [Leptospira gomenensis]TGK35882.1 phosphoribosylanthranilate isomerase [Leptospira gomenensis]TGK41037.1 phosphoribosylanthranilate isomerase [Leptospira gomenensis]TGK61266.1 phosphoribosylanthranilate isomerase [Leptospira gomenensis]